MKLSEQVKPISYLKAHAPEIIRKLKDNPQPVVITLHGEAKAILQDIGQYKETQETLGLLKVLALTNRQVEEGAPLRNPSRASEIVWLTANPDAISCSFRRGRGTRDRGSLSLHRQRAGAETPGHFLTEIESACAGGNIPKEVGGDRNFRISGTTP